MADLSAHALIGAGHVRGDGVQVGLRPGRRRIVLGSRRGGLRHLELEFKLTKLFLEILELFQTVVVHALQVGGAETGPDLVDLRLQNADVDLVGPDLALELRNHLRCDHDVVAPVQVDVRLDDLLDRDTGDLGLDVGELDVDPLVGARIGIDAEGVLELVPGIIAQAAPGALPVVGLHGAVDDAGLLEELGDGADVPVARLHVLS